jgi:hypothetical protein
VLVKLVMLELLILVVVVAVVLELHHEEMAALVDQEL